jgi:magnesium chelatase subunit I
MLIDYGKDYEIVKLALRSRIELEYEDEISKDDVIVKLTEEAINKTCGEIYNVIPRRDFKGLMSDLSDLCFEPVSVEESFEFESYPDLYRTLLLLAKSRDELNSSFEILLESIRRCTGLIERVGFGEYVYSRS